MVRTSTQFDSAANVNDSSSNYDQRMKTLEAIHDEAVDAIITIDEAGIIDSVNPATEGLFGYSKTELIGQNVKILMPSPYREAHDRYVRSYLETGDKKIIGIGREVIGQRKSGETFPIHLAVSEINVGPTRKFAGVIRDLTEFKKLEEQKTTLGQIIEDSLNEIFIFDAESLKFIQVNRGACENLGYSIEDLQSMTPIDIKPEFTEDAFRENIEPLRSGETQLLRFDTIHRRKNGTDYEVEVHLQTGTYRNRAVYVAIILDVTLRRQAEREVEQQRLAMQQELEQLVESRTAELRDTQAELVRSEKFSTLGKVSGGIAHEIRNPLNAVKTSAYYLLNAQSATPEKVREHLERIDRQVSLIDNVVTALSDVAKLPEAQLVSADAIRVIRNAVSAMKLPENIQVDYEFSDDVPKVLFDESQITIAIKNLLRNARDAMPEGGKLTIESTVDDQKVSFSFCDNGCGIAPEMLDQVMEPLFTTKARGMGLGLSITKAIVEKNNGQLTVESELGQGSCFRISLDRAVSSGR